MNDKKSKFNILCIFPGPTYRPDLIDFKDRFIMLSSAFTGEVLSWSDDKKYETYEMGDFVFRGLISVDKPPGKLQRALHIIKSAIRFNKKRKIDLIICYEPVFTGFFGAILKKLLNTKLVVELNNSDIAEAVIMEMGDNFKAKSKVILFKILRSVTLKFTDGIKLLTENQRNNLEEKYKKKIVFCFHDFVPTHYFIRAEKKMDNYILFVGYPFHRKGIDFLVKAFGAIKKDFPDMELLLIGHRLEEEAIKYLGEWDRRIKFIKPMFYDELRPYFLNCYCFVLPSREEGMGRVLLEAMASGKAVIGSNVGGISDLISDGRNGYLFESGNIEELSLCLRKILSDKSLAQSMGKEGVKFINNKFSSEMYMSHFTDMVNEVCKVEVLK